MSPFLEAAVTTEVESLHLNETVKDVINEVKQAIATIPERKTISGVLDEVFKHVWDVNTLYSIHYRQSQQITSTINYVFGSIFLRNISVKYRGKFESSQEIVQIVQDVFKNYFDYFKSIRASQSGEGETNFEFWYSLFNNVNRSQAFQDYVVIQKQLHFNPNRSKLINEIPPLDGFLNSELSKIILPYDQVGNLYEAIGILTTNHLYDDFIKKLQNLILYPYKVLFNQSSNDWESKLLNIQNFISQNTPHMQLKIILRYTFAPSDLKQLSKSEIESLEKTLGSFLLAAGEVDANTGRSKIDDFNQAINDRINFERKKRVNNDWI